MALSDTKDNRGNDWIPFEYVESSWFGLASFVSFFRWQGDSVQCDLDLEQSTTFSIDHPSDRQAEKVIPRAKKASQVTPRGAGKAGPGRW